MTMGSMKQGSKEDKSVKIIGGKNPCGADKVAKDNSNTMMHHSKIPTSEKGTMKKHSSLIK